MLQTTVIYVLALHGIFKPCICVPVLPILICVSVLCCTVVTLAPGTDTAGESLSALRFASRASKVSVKAQVNRYKDYEALYREMKFKLQEFQSKYRFICIDLFAVLIVGKGQVAVVCVRAVQSITVFLHFPTICYMKMTPCLEYNAQAVPPIQSTVPSSSVGSVTCSSH